MIHQLVQIFFVEERSQLVQANDLLGRSILAIRDKEPTIYPCKIYLQERWL
jgi:hypothetical protein